MSVKVWKNAHRWGLIEDLHVTCLDCGTQMSIVDTEAARSSGKTFPCQFTRGAEEVDVADRRRR
jgi:hypothetical protein